MRSSANTRENILLIMSRRRGRLGVFLRRPRHSSLNELCLRTHEGSGPVNENLPEGGRHGRPPQQESHTVDAKKTQQLSNTNIWQINQASIEWTYPRSHRVCSCRCRCHTCGKKEGGKQLFYPLAPRHSILSMFNQEFTGM